MDTNETASPDSSNDALGLSGYKGTWWLMFTGILHFFHLSELKQPVQNGGDGHP